MTTIQMNYLNRPLVVYYDVDESVRVTGEWFGSLKAIATTRGGGAAMTDNSAYNYGLQPSRLLTKQSK
jgi:hypothetical protein